MEGALTEDTRMKDAGYLTQYLKQSFGWVKIAEYALPTREDAQRIQDEIRARYPNDKTRFEIRWIQ